MRSETFISRWLVKRVRFETAARGGRNLKKIPGRSWFERTICLKKGARRLEEEEEVRFSKIQKLWRRIWQNGRKVEFSFKYFSHVLNILEEARHTSFKTTKCK